MAGKYVKKLTEDEQQIQLTPEEINRTLEEIENELEQAIEEGLKKSKIDPTEVGKLAWNTKTQMVLNSKNLTAAQFERLLAIYREAKQKVDQVMEENKARNEKESKATRNARKGVADRITGMTDELSKKQESREEFDGEKAARILEVERDALREEVLEITRAKNEIAKIKKKYALKILGIKRDLDKAKKFNEECGGTGYNFEETLGKLKTTAENAAKTVETMIREGRNLNVYNYETDDFREQKKVQEDAEKKYKDFSQMVERLNSKRTRFFTDKINVVKWSAKTRAYLQTASQSWEGFTKFASDGLITEIGDEENQKMEEVRKKTKHIELLRTGSKVKETEPSEVTTPKTIQERTNVANTMRERGTSTTVIHPGSGERQSDEKRKAEKRKAEKTKNQKEKINVQDVKKYGDRAVELQRLSRKEKISRNWF